MGRSVEILVSAELGSDRHDVEGDSKLALSRPSAVSRDELISLGHRGRSYDESIWQPKGTVAGSEPGCFDRHLRVQVDDLDRESLEGISRDLNGLFTSSCRADETLGKRGHRHCEPISVVESSGQSRGRLEVVGVVGVEESDDDAGIEMGQSHSARRPSSSLCS